MIEVGCGQGDSNCTVVLAAVVGSDGSVTTIDSANLDYGVEYVFSMPNTQPG